MDGHWIVCTMMSEEQNDALADIVIADYILSTILKMLPPKEIAAPVKEARDHLENARYRLGQ